MRVHTRAYACVYTSVHVCVHVCARACACTRVCMRACVCVRVCARMRVWAHASACTYHMRSGTRQACRMSTCCLRCLFPCVGLCLGGWGCAIPTSEVWHIGQGQARRVLLAGAAYGAPGGLHAYDLCSLLRALHLRPQFEAHRGARVRGEAEIARIEACCACLRQEIKKLEGAADAATATSSQAMQKVGPWQCVHVWSADASVPPLQLIREHEGARFGVLHHRAPPCCCTVVRLHTAVPLGASMLLHWCAPPYCCALGRLHAAALLCASILLCHCTTGRLPPCCCAVVRLHAAVPLDAT